MDIETRPRSRHTLLLRIIFAGVVVLAALAGWLWWLTQDAQTVRGALQTVSRKVDFPLYYPQELPAGFHFNRQSVSVTKQVVGYVITYDTNKTLFVSMQPKGGGFDEGSLNPTSDFTTTIGHVYMADLPDRTTAAIVGESSWVLINAPKKVAVDRLTTFINSLRQF